jgi:selenide,water dikinase
MGIITHGIKHDRTSEATATEAIRVMSELNHGAADAMVAVGVSAATDVTGFGLIGHLLGMLEADVSAELVFDDIPVLLEAVELAATGILPGGSQRNLDAMSMDVDARELDDARLRVLFDAQTSGGLLIALPSEDSERLHVELATRGITSAATIGRLVPGNRRIRVS